MEDYWRDFELQAIRFWLRYLDDKEREEQNELTINKKN
jgi:hypothetical protein